MFDRVASRYNIEIPLRDGRSLVFNSLTGGLALMSVAEANTLAQIKGDQRDDLDLALVDKLEEGGFVVRESTDELEVLQQSYEAHRFDPSSMVLTVAPTMACNFKCDYCFQGQDKPSQTMPREVQDALMELVEAAHDDVKMLHVAWYGGEPLLRRKLIFEMSDRLIEICDRKQITFSAMAVSNGYMLDLDTARKLYERNCTWIQITLDGTPEYHDSRRYLLGGKGSFERIVDNLRSVVDEVPILYTIRVNIDERNQKDIHRLIEYLAEAGLGHRKNLKMYFAPIEAMTEGCHVVEDVTLTKGRYGQLEAELYRHGYKAGLTNLPYPPRFHGTCGAVRPNGLVILPSGELHKCWDTVSMPHRSIGSIFRPREVAGNPLVKQWLNWTPFDNNSCRNCKLLPSCAGACAYKFVHSESTRGEAAVLPCPSWKYNIKERLLWRAIASGKVKEEDYDPEEVKTVPSELCADDIIEGGKDLPEEMQAHYERQKRYLPVVV